MIHQYRGQVCFPTFCISLITRHHRIGGEPSTIGSLDASEEEGHEGCHDMDPITGDQKNGFQHSVILRKKNASDLGGGNSNIFHFHRDPWRNHPIWRADFSNGLKRLTASRAPQKSEGWKNLKKRDFCGQLFCFVCDDNKPIHIPLDLGGTMAWQRKILGNQQEIRKETKATPVFESVFTFQVSPVSAVLKYLGCKDR